MAASMCGLRILTRTRSCLLILFNDFLTKKAMMLKTTALVAYPLNPIFLNVSVKERQ